VGLGSEIDIRAPPISVAGFEVGRIAVVDYSKCQADGYSSSDAA